LGLFQKTINALFDQLKNDDFVGEINFCNHNSHAGYRKIKERVELSILNFFQTDNDLFRKKMIVNFSKSFEFKEGEISEEILESASEMKFTTGIIYFSRNYDSLKWRLISIPTRKYRYCSISKDGHQAALVIFKKYEESADIMEMFYDSDYEKDRYNLFGTLVSYLLENGHKKINMWSNLHSNEHVELEKLGFKETFFSTYFGVIPFSTNKDIQKYANWHYRFFDSDVF
jgi:hypothetical protein